MNYRYSLHIIGRILRVMAALMLLPVIVSFIYGEGNAIWFLIPAFLMLVLGITLALIKTKDNNIYAREGFVIVALIWLIISALGALPFTLSGYIPSYVDAFFETVSGFTTTGASILTNVEAMPHSMLFWRSFTHWIGGMGVLAFAFAILSQRDTRTVHIIRAESPGPTFGKLVSKMQMNSQILYGIYIFLTVSEFLFLVFGGMPVFDSIVHTFGTAGTGGFSMKNLSIAAYDSVYFDTVIGIFMILFGVNFNMYFFLLVCRFSEVWHYEELRWYIYIIAFSVTTITINLLPVYETFGKSLRYAFFQVASIITTTGYATADFNQWPAYSKVLLVLLMFIGTCVSSTGGGIKIMRVIILVKTALKEVRYSLDPRLVKSIMFDKKPVDHSVVTGVNSYFIAYILIILVSTVIISIDGFDVVTDFTAVIACLNNIGPGLGEVGAAGNFSGFSILSKLVLSFNMLAGRLELFPMLILFAPSTWRK